MPEGAPALSIVVPCYNEEGSVWQTIEELSESLGTRLPYEIIFANDGSTDRTPQIQGKAYYEKPDDSKGGYIQQDTSLPVREQRSGLPQDDAGTDCQPEESTELIVDQQCNNWSKPTMIQDIAGAGIFRIDQGNTAKRDIEPYERLS